MIEDRPSWYVITFGFFMESSAKLVFSLILFTIADLLFGSMNAYCPRIQCTSFFFSFFPFNVYTLVCVTWKLCKIMNIHIGMHIGFNVNILQIFWAFSVYLEAVAILPQLVLLQRSGNVDNLTGQYVFFLGYVYTSVVFFFFDIIFFSMIYLLKFCLWLSTFFCIYLFYLDSSFAW